MYTNSEIQTRLKDSGFPRLIPAYLRTTGDNTIDSEALNDGLAALFDNYYLDRIEQSYEKNIVKAALPRTGVTIDDVDWQRFANVKWYKVQQIRDGKWIQQSRSVLIHGNDGDEQVKLGCALSIEFMYQGLSVRSAPLKQLTFELIEAHTKQTLKKAISALKRIDVLFIYEFELTQLSALECYLLASLVSARAMKGGFLISSSSLPDKWCKQVDDVGLIDAVNTQIDPDLIALNMLSKHNKEGKHG
ncbi:MAG: ATP-binding protein [Pseudomonadota bacterium]|nr:ATP-binding protein [Pseudomonadota bacterium]